MFTALLKSNDTATATRDEFDRDTSSTTKEVECSGLVEVNIVLEDVEEVHLGKVCRGASIETLGDVEATTLVLPSDDTHCLLVVRGWGYFALKVGETLVALDRDLGNIGVE